MAKQKTIDPIVELKERELQGQVLDLAVTGSAIVSCAENHRRSVRRSRTLP